MKTTDDKTAALEAPDAGVVAELVDALRFYAKWPNPDSVDDYGIYDDCGRSARTALAKWDAK